jgi:hypothetical protein
MTRLPRRAPARSGNGAVMLVLVVLAATVLDGWRAARGPAAEADASTLVVAGTSGRRARASLAVAVSLVTVLSRSALGPRPVTAVGLWGLQRVLLNDPTSRPIRLVDGSVC